MKIRDAMNTPVFSCAPELRLQEVAKMMMEDDCGVVPVAETGGRLVGIVTDRDICRIFAREGAVAAGMHVRQAMTKDVLTCRDSDEVDAALEVMGTRQVRRLPVVNLKGRLCGILSMDDVILRAEKEGGISYDAVVGTLRNLCTGRLLARHAIAVG